MIRILAADGMEKDAVCALKDKGFEVVEEHYEVDELSEKIKEFDVIVVRSATKVREPIIDAAKTSGKLQLIIRGGVGVDNIDVKYAESKGITVRNTPCASSASVAELALGHMFSLARFIGISNVTMRNGEWNKKKYEGSEISGKTLGLVGFGRIAQALAKKAEALGMTVVYTRRSGENADFPQYKYLPLDELLKVSDFVSLHIPMPADKQPVIGERELSLMKPTAFIINTARGGVVCEGALIKALDEGKLAGAGIDVFAEEPTKNEALCKHPKVSVTPHIGGATAEAQARIGEEIVDIITKHFA